MSRLHWIDLSTAGRLAIAARPRAEDWLEEEIGGWAAERVDVAVSLLEPAEVHDLGLQREAALCRAHGMTFLSFPISDRGLPGSRRAAAALAWDLGARLTQGETVMIHCRAGIGRSAVIAACVMTRLGVAAADALARIAAARGVAVPDTEEQRAWVMAMTGELRGLAWRFAPIAKGRTFKSGSPTSRLVAVARCPRRAVSEPRRDARRRRQNG